MPLLVTQHVDGDFIDARLFKNMAEFKAWDKRYQRQHKGSEWDFLNIASGRLESRGE